ncbi:hypothetical protein MRX96_020075 [Rhipicephalus microplus]
MAATTDLPVRENCFLFTAPDGDVSLDDLIDAIELEAVHDKPAKDEQNGHPVTSRSAEQTTGFQVLKPRSPAPTTSRTPNYWDNAAEHERVDEHATLPEPEPPMDAGENGSQSSHDGTDTEQAASSSPETSSAETLRESWVVSLSEGEE